MGDVLIFSLGAGNHEDVPAGYSFLAVVRHHACYGLWGRCDSGHGFSRQLVDGGGGQVRLHLGEVFAIEGSADYRKNDYGNDTTVHTFPVQASGLLYLLPGKRVSPFLLGGAGWYFTNVNGPDGYDKTQNRFGLHAGGGLQVMLSRNWSVDGSYRFVWLERIQSKDENLQNKKFQDEGHMVTIGLNYHF